MTLLVLHVAEDRELATRIARKLSANGIDAETFDANEPVGTTLKLSDADLAVLLMSEASSDSADFATAVQQVDFHDVPFITVRNGTAVPGEKIKFYVQVGQWLDIDATHPEKTFDQLAHAILNPESRPSKSPVKTERYRVRRALMFVFAVFVAAVGLTLWLLGEREKVVSEAARLADETRELALLRPETTPWYYVHENQNARLAPEINVNLTVPDYMAGHIVEGVFFRPDGTQVGFLNNQTLSSSKPNLETSLSENAEHLWFCVIFDRAVGPAKRRRQLMVLAPDGSETDPIVQARVATRDDTCAEAAGIVVDPQQQAKLQMQKQIVTLYTASNLVSIWTVADDGDGVEVKTLIRGGGQTTDKLAMTYRIRSYALIGDVWRELPNLSGSRLRNADLPRPGQFFFCVETFVPAENIYLADWALISNEVKPVFTRLASPMEVSSETICDKLPDSGPVQRLPDAFTVEEKTVPPETTPTAIAGIEIGMPLQLARQKVSSLMRTPAPDPTEGAFDDLFALAGRRDHLPRLKEEFRNGKVEFLSDPDAGIGIALVHNATHSEVAGVYYAFRPSIYVSRTHPNGLRATVIRQALVERLGQPTSDDGFGDRDGSSEAHELRWGSGGPPYCRTPKRDVEPIDDGKPDRSSYSLALTTDRSAPICRRHIGFSHKRNFDNESMVLWMMGDQ